MKETYKDVSAPTVGTRVLFVSDDLDTARIWAYALRQTGLEVVLTGLDRDTIQRWAGGTFDLVIIDVHTAQLYAIGLCRRLRPEIANPILLFIPIGDEEHVLEAYQAGADDCIVKPIGPALFLAKVRAWLRRSWTIQAEALNSLEVNGLRLDPTRREVVTATGATTKLTNLEFRLLHLLMSHRGQVLESDYIINRVWGYASSGDSILLKNSIYRLRQKVEPDPGQPYYIQTVTGQGYVFRPE